MVQRAKECKRLKRAGLSKSFCIFKLVSGHSRLSQFPPSTNFTVDILTLPTRYVPSQRRIYIFGLEQILNETKEFQRIPMLVLVLESFTSHHTMNIALTNKAVLILTIR